MFKQRASGAETLRVVLSFTFRHWARRKGLAGGIALATSLATLTEVFVPLFAGRLVDALAGGPANGTIALDAFLVMAALGLVMVGLRHLAWWGVVPLTLGIMSDVAQDAFRRVQRFSTDWHANSFAGSTVRKITRGMWALDSLNDVLLLALLPSLVVLVGTVVLLGLQWPVMGLVMAIGAHRLWRAHHRAGDAGDRAGLAALQCLGHPHGRRALRCARAPTPWSRRSAPRSARMRGSPG